MKDVREKLVELLTEFYGCDPMYYDVDALAIADHLVSNGVTVHESSCPYCCDNGEGHGMLKHSYDDEDGMEMSIHPSIRKENGYQSQAWWATVHFRGECRDFYIEVCPFCGRRLVPLKEERDATATAAERRMIVAFSVYVARRKDLICPKCGEYEIGGKDANIKPNKRYKRLPRNCWNTNQYV